MADSAIVTESVKTFFSGVLFLEKEKGACIVSPDLMPPDIY